MTTKKTIVTALLVLITLCVPLSLYSQSQDFVMNGTVLAKYNGSAASVTIPASVTSIGDYAFYGTSLISITIPTGVISMGESAFAECRSIRNVTIPSSVTSIGERAFFNCTSLTSITVDNQNRAYLSVDGILFNKNRTILIRYPEGKQETSYTIPSSVTSIGSLSFSYCSSLTSITIPSSVTSIGDRAFAECTSLTSITIPSSVTSIGDYAFYGTSLTSVTIPSSVISIGDYAFNRNVRIIDSLLSGTTWMGSYAEEIMVLTFNRPNFTMTFHGETVSGRYTLSGNAVIFEEKATGILAGNTLTLEYGAVDKIRLTKQ
jgi:hypothetical protein